MGNKEDNPLNSEALAIEVKEIFTARSRITGADPTAIDHLESVK